MKRTYVAIGIQIAIMVLVLVPPMLVKLTGTTVYLETEKMDPRSLFRGHYVILGYKVAQDVLPDDGRSRWNRHVDLDSDNVVYITVTTDRPGKFVAVSEQMPDLQPGQACIVGRKRGWGGDVDFPQIAQFFAPKKEAQMLERLRGDDLLARVKVTGNCNAVLMGLEGR